MASHIDRSYFVTLFDEFKSVPGKKIDIYLTNASRRIDQDAWGDCYEEATAYLAAHLLVSGGGAGGAGGAVAGPITSQSVGDLSRSYGQVNVGSAGDETYATTKYGQMYLELRRECIVPGLATCESIPGAKNGLL